MSSALLSWWQRLFQPSLTRRLLTAQFALMLALWGLSMAFLVWVMFHEGAADELNRRFNLVFTIADNLADHPDRMQRTLRQVDEFLRTDNAVEDKPDGRVSMVVWDRERVVFASPGLELRADLHNTQLNVLQPLPMGGSRWSGITRQSPNSGIRVMLLAPGAASDIWLTLTLKGFLVVPLVISLPLLVLPAWLSVRLALRPWRSLSDELASRGSRDLHPLAFRAEHRELRPLVGNLNALLERLRASANRERNFIADAAHELRTPLAAMRVNVEVLRGHAVTASHTQLLDGILRSNARVTRLVGQLLALTRNEAVTDMATTLFLDEVVRDRLAFLAELARASQVELELHAESDVRVMAGIESLVSLIDNLVENAIKYSPPRAVVAVTVECADGCAILEVSDEGPGIPAERLARVFDRFYRAPDQVQTGSGLGLAIVKAAVERNGGTISLGPTCASHGLTVRVQLPLWISGAAAADLSFRATAGERFADRPETFVKSPGSRV